MALVTGGATGIGRALTRSLAEAGARVCIASRRREVLERVAAELNARLGREVVFPYVFDLPVKAETEADVRLA